MTRTFVYLFDEDDVNRVMGEAARVLETDWEERSAYVSTRNRHAGDARIKALHALWAMMLEPAPEQ